MEWGTFISWNTERRGYPIRRTHRYSPIAAFSNSDVYTENGWKTFQEEKKRIAQSKPEVVDLEAEVVEEVVKPVQITIFLQGPRKKLRIKVLEVHISCRIPIDVDCDDQENDTSLQNGM